MVAIALFVIAVRLVGEMSYYINPPVVPVGSITVARARSLFLSRPRTVVSRSMSRIGTLRVSLFYLVCRVPRVDRVLLAPQVVPLNRASSSLPVFVAKLLVVVTFLLTRPRRVVARARLLIKPRPLQSTCLLSSLPP